MSISGYRSRIMYGFNFSDHLVFLGKESIFLLLLLLLLLYTKMSRAYKAILLRDKENDFTNRNDHPGDS
jgi:hypothetical protein